MVDFCIDTCRRQQIAETLSTGIRYHFRVFVPSDFYIDTCRRQQIAETLSTRIRYRFRVLVPSDLSHFVC